MLNILSALPEAMLRPSFDDVMPVFMIVLYIAIFGAMLLYLLVLWLFRSISVYKLSKKLNLNMPWIGFIPYCLPFAYGRIAEKYNKNIFKKPIKFSILLLVLQFVPDIAMIIFFTLFIVLGVISALLESEALMIITFIVIYFVMFGVLMISTVLLNLFNILACWNVFGIFGGEKHILLFILSITLGIEPFVLFAVRNNEPQNLREEFVIPKVVEEN